MHSICYNYAPKSFDGFFYVTMTGIWNTNIEIMMNMYYVVPSAKIEFFKRFPLYTFPIAWNTLGDLTFQSNRTTFQIALKEFLLSELN